MVLSSEEYCCRDLSNTQILLFFPEWGWGGVSRTGSMLVSRKVCREEVESMLWPHHPLTPGTTTGAHGVHLPTFLPNCISQDSPCSVQCLPRGCR